MPKSRTEYWNAKIIRNQERDKRVKRELGMMGWHSITIWECQLKPPTRDRTLESLAYTLNRIFLLNHGAKTYNTPEQEPAAKVAEERTEYWSER
jgi:DNA mismatch endonuclease (patch repair protein)